MRGFFVVVAAFGLCSSGSIHGVCFLQIEGRFTLPLIVGHLFISDNGEKLIGPILQVTNPPEVKNSKKGYFPG